MFNLQVNDDRIILDKTLADQVSAWKSSRGLAEHLVLNHACSGESCTYFQIGDVFVCEKTGSVHGKSNLLFGQDLMTTLLNKTCLVSIDEDYVEYDCLLFFVVCDDTCKEVITDPTNGLLVCTISGRCSDAEMEPDAVRHFSF